MTTIPTRTRVRLINGFTVSVVLMTLATVMTYLTFDYSSETAWMPIVLFIGSICGSFLTYMFKDL